MKVARPEVRETTPYFMPLSRAPEIRDEMPSQKMPSNSIRRRGNVGEEEGAPVDAGHRNLSSMLPRRKVVDLMFIFSESTCLNNLKV